ncbi:MAG: hypothetical protein GW938_12750 [Leptospira sp.]|nr:hypothetical protein [Leptospira sp.]
MDGFRFFQFLTAFESSSLVLVLIVIGFANCKENSNPEYITEVAIYKIKSDQIPNTQKFIRIVDEFLAKRKGFLSINRMQDIDDPSVYIDIVNWQSKEDAESAAKAAESETSMLPFFEATEKVIYFGHNKYLQNKTEPSL